MGVNNDENRIDYKEIVKDAVLNEDTFLRLTLSNKLHDDGTPWVKITVRPVLIKGKRKMQFSYFDPKKGIAKNLDGDEIMSGLNESLAIPFSQVHVQTMRGDTHIRITRKGRALMTKGKPSCTEQDPTLAHDRTKAYLIPAGTPDSFLYALGITNKQGEVRAGMQGKYHQINEFLRIIEQVIPGIKADGRPIRVVDCGSGNAYLTFAAYHYLHDTCGLDVRVVGIEVNDELTRKCSDLRDTLGWQGLEFKASKIADYVPDEPPDIVLSLHACDTATDDAIARGILWGSQAILASPCCQHELHEQLHAPLFRPILRHGILRERLADILTDAFRALVLRIMGYRTSVIQFVSPEHTSKNLMIRAEKAFKPGHAVSAREYKELKEYWEVSPCIEELLGDDIRRYLCD